MTNQVSRAIEPRSSKRVLIALTIIVVLGGAALLAGGVYWWFSGQNMAGLQGTWRDTNNPKHIYEFQANGDLDAWVGSKSWLNRIGWSATWRRDGQQIMIRTDRNWDLKGQLEGGTIRGKVLLKNETWAVENEIDTVWQKE
jgi:hypothetical protein